MKDHVYQETKKEKKQTPLGDFKKGDAGAS